MSKFFQSRILTPCMALLLALFCTGGTALLCLYSPSSAPKTEALLYLTAVHDAITIEDGEVLPLVRILPESNMVTWHDGKVLLMTIHRHPERYPVNATFPLLDEVWTFTEREMTAWYAAHKTGVTDWPLRFKQLIGVPPEAEYTHMTAMWVLPDDIIRPAYNTDIASDTMPVTLPQDVREDYKVWFESNIVWSYFTSAYPWTRLGYTYDWAENSGEYGLTEFLVRKGAEVEVLFTDNIDEFRKRMK